MTENSPSGGWLIGFSIGPVADFMAASRRLSDIWFGSHGLSLIAGAALAAAEANGARSIFPGNTGNAGLQLQNDVAAALPNRAVLWLPTESGKSPGDVLTVCNVHATSELIGLAAKTKKTFIGGSNAASLLVTDEFDDQIGKLLEFYSAWVCCASVSDDEKYRSAYRLLQRTLLARKRTRTFAPNSGLDVGRSKSVLDASRPSVLEGNYLAARSGWRADHRRRHGIDRDALDAPGLIKRVLGRGGGGGQKIRYPAITRIALQPWINRLGAIEQGQLLSELDKAYKAVAKADWGSPSAPHREFEYDGQLLFDGRLDLASRQIKEEMADERDPVLLQKLSDAGVQLDELDKTMSCAREAAGHPDPFVAMVALDIDRFGQKLWEGNMDMQLGLASLAAEFATSVRNVVSAHQGFLLYAGGDEALAILPLPGALPMACESAKCLRDLATARGIEGLTLSAGVLMAHALTPLARMRRDVMAALALAKRPVNECERQRDALAILAQPRSGTAIRVRGRWGQASADDNLAQRLDTWVDAMYSKCLPMGAPGLVGRAFALCGGEVRLLSAALARFCRRRGETPARVAPWENLADAVISDRLDDRVGPSAAAARLEAEWRLARWLCEHGVGRAGALRDPARMTADEEAA